MEGGTGSEATWRKARPERPEPTRTDISRWEEIGFAFCCALNRRKLEEAGFRFDHRPGDGAVEGRRRRTSHT